MKSLILILLFGTTVLHAQDPAFNVSIEQDRSVIIPEDDLVKLKKAPFNIILNFSEPMGVLVGAYFTPEDYYLAKGGLDKSEIPSFVGGGMADYMFNEKKLVMVASDAVNYWFYESGEAHSFDEVVVNDDGSVTCIRRIENIDDIYGDFTTVRELDKPLYLVFISAKYDDDYNETEIQRFTMKLTF